MRFDLAPGAWRTLMKAARHEEGAVSFQRTLTTVVLPTPLCPFPEALERRVHVYYTTQIAWRKVLLSHAADIAPSRCETSMGICGNNQPGSDRLIYIPHSARVWLLIMTDCTSLPHPIPCLFFPPCLFLQTMSAERSVVGQLQARELVRLSYSEGHRRNGSSEQPMLHPRLRYVGLSWL